MKKILLLLFLSSLIINANAQVDLEEEYEFQEKREVFMNLNVLLTAPRGLYKERQPETGFGWGGNLLFEVKKPVFIGIEGAWQRYDKETDTYTAFDGDFSYLEEEATSNQVLSMNGLIRVKPELDFFVNPYFDGIFGYNFFYTRTVFKDLDLDENLNSFNENSDWSIFYGAALGVQINLMQNLLYLDLRCAYLLGNNAEFYSRIPGSNLTIPIDNFELRTAPYSVIMPQIGITFILTDNEKGYEE